MSEKIKPIEERTDRDLLELVLQLHGRGMTSTITRKVHEAYIDANLELVTRLDNYKALESELSTLKAERDNSPVFWVARNKFGVLQLFESLPERNDKGWWTFSFTDNLQIDRNLFPDLTWEHKPQRVALLKLGE